MPLNLRVRGFFFGLFASILAAAWVRGAGLALGGDAWGVDLTIAALLLSFAAGTAIGSKWVTGTSSRWWPAFAIFGVAGGVLILWIPSLSYAFQLLYHNLGAGFFAGLASFAIVVVLAFLPWAAGGVAFARMTAGADGEMITPLSFGGAVGLALLDFWLGPFLGGIPLLVIACAGLCGLASGHNISPPLVDREPREAARALVLAFLMGLFVAGAAKVVFLLLLQFFPGARWDQTWVNILVLASAALGAIGFGNPATLSRTPLIWVGLFVSFTGSFLAVSAWVVQYLSQPDRYLYYFRFFGAQEGSLLQGFFLVAAVAGLPALALGAAIRCVSDPVSSSGRPTTAASASALAFGAAGGLLLGSFQLVPSFGLQGSLLLLILLLVGLGVFGILIVSQGEKNRKVLATTAALLLALLAVPQTPARIEYGHPYAPGTISVLDTVEGPDGVAQATIEPGRVTQLWWNHNPLCSPQESLERTEIALSLLEAYGPDEALLLSPLTPLRADLLGKGGIVQIDLSPHVPILGELSRRLNPANAKPLVSNFRAAAGSPRQYPLILALSEPLWPAVVSSRWSEQAFEAIRERLTESGCFILWLRPQEASAAALRAISRSFAEVFPSANVLVAVSGLDGPSFALVGRNRLPVKAGAARVRELLEAIHRNGTFAGLPLATVQEFEGLHIAHRERILETTVGSPPTRGPLAQIAWDLSPRFHPAQRVEGVEFLMALSTTGAARDEENSDSEDRRVALRLLLSGFIDHIRAQKHGPHALAPGEGEMTEGEMRRFLDALKAWPAFTPALRLWEEVAQKAIEKRQFAMAAHFLAEACEAVPGRASFHRLLGRALSGEGKTEAAVGAFRKAIDLDAKNPAAFLDLGLSLAKLGDHRQAAKNLERARELAPENPAMLAALALSYKELGDLKRARKTIEEALKVSPQDPRVRELADELLK